MNTRMIAYTLTREAFVAYNLYYFARSPAIRRLVWLCQFVPPAVVMVFCGTLYLLGRMTATFASLVSAATYGVFVLFYPLLFRRMAKRRLEKMLDEGMGREFIGEHVLELGEAGLHDTVSGHVMAVPYRNVEKAVENDGHLYLFFGPTTAFVIPLQALEGEGGVTAFLAVLAEKGAHIEAARFA